MPGPIAVKLQVLRQERGLTQKEAAKLANVSPGHTACPSRSWWRSSPPYDSHGRSDFLLSRRETLRERRLYLILRSSQVLSSTKFIWPHCRVLSMIGEASWEASLPSLYALSTLTDRVPARTPSTSRIPLGTWRRTPPPARTPHTATLPSGSRRRSRAKRSSLRRRKRR